MSKYVTTSPSTAVPAAFRNVPKSPIDGFPTRREGLFEDGVIKDDDVKQSNAGKRLDRLLNETAGLLANGNDVIRALKEGAAQLVALGKKSRESRRIPPREGGRHFLAEGTVPPWVRSRTNALTRKRLQARAEKVRGHVNQLIQLWQKAVQDELNVVPRTGLIADLFLAAGNNYVDLVAMQAKLSMDLRQALALASEAADAQRRAEMLRNEDFERESRRLCTECRQRAVADSKIMRLRCPTLHANHPPLQRPRLRRPGV